MINNVLIAAAIGLGAFATSTSAVTISLVPETSTAVLGQPLSVDVMAALGGGEIVSAYDLNLRYDPTILTATDVTFNTALGNDPADPLFHGFSVTSGLLDFAEVSLFTDSDLVTLQNPPSSIKLATILFSTDAVGTSAFNFINYGQPGIDIKGSNNTPYDQPVLADQNVTVTAVPLPAGWILLSSALAGLGGLRRRPVRK